MADNRQAAEEKIAKELRWSIIGPILVDEYGGKRPASQYEIDAYTLLRSREMENMRLREALQKIMLDRSDFNRFVLIVKEALGE